MNASTIYSFYSEETVTNIVFVLKYIILWKYIETTEKLLSMTSNVFDALKPYKYITNSKDLDFWKPYFKPRKIHYSYLKERLIKQGF